MKTIVYLFREIEKKDWLLVIGLALAPMTGLRIWKVGPAELLCLVWSFKYIYNCYLTKSDFLAFSFVFLTSMTLGTVFCLLKYPNESDVTGLLTWVYLLVVANTMFNCLTTNDSSYNEKLLSAFMYIAVGLSFTLYIYSITISKIFFGAPLFYGPRFTSGGNNPHQIACMLCGLNTILFCKIIKKENILVNIIYFFISLFLLIQTQSSTGLMGVTTGIFLGVVIQLGGKNKKGNLLIFFNVFIVILVLSYSFLYEKFMSWVASDSNGLGRLELFSTFWTAFVKDPIFGLGPGIHANDGVMEFHNTYLEILAATGVVGFLSFLCFSIKAFIKAFKVDALYLPALLAMYVYGFAGFAMRRLAYWGIFTIISAIVVTKQTGGKYAANHNNSGV